MIQTADGALERGPLDAAAHARPAPSRRDNDTKNTGSHTAITEEAGDLSREIYRITDGTKFNGIDLLKGGAKAFQVGASGTATTRSPRPSPTWAPRPAP